MDAGLAALLGAAVGSLATLGAALVNGRSQARAQRDQWRRQHRRDAYVGYLGALHDRDIAMDAVRAALRPGAPDSVNAVDAVDSVDVVDLDEKLGRFVTLAREVHRAVEIVIIEGPDSVVAAAERVTHASQELARVVGRMGANARAGAVAGAADDAALTDAALAEERERSLYRAVKDFRHAARAAVGNGD